MMCASAVFSDENAAQHAIDRLVEEHFPAGDIRMRALESHEEVEVSNHQYFRPPTVMGAITGAVIGLILVLATPYGTGPFGTDIRIFLGATILGGFLGSFVGLFYWRVLAQTPDHLAGRPFEVLVDAPEERAMHAASVMAAHGGKNVKTRPRQVVPPTEPGESPDMATLPDPATNP